MPPALLGALLAACPTASCSAPSPALLAPCPALLPALPCWLLDLFD